MTTKKEACPECQKKGLDTAGDNLVTNEEHGYKKCFSCGHYEGKGGMLAGKYVAVEDRGLSKTTCEKYSIQIASYSGKFYSNKTPIEVTNERCAVFNYYDKGKVVKQKIRSMSNKKYMTQKGDTKFTSLFGKHLFNPGKGVPVVITEGEWDAATVWQETELPAVSLPNGAAGVTCLTKELDWLQGWKHIVLMFDQDEAGQEAVEKALKLLPVGRVRVASLPHKDANECLMLGKGKELRNRIWNASIRRPESIVTISDIISDILEKPTWGYKLPWDMLNKACYGLQPNHIYAIIGAAKVGKTEFLKEIIFSLIDEEKIPVGIFSLEQAASSTVQRMVGSMVNKRLHLPDESWWDKEEIKQKALEFENKLYLYKVDSDESLTLENLLISIRYMHFCYGIKVIVLDNLTAMCHNATVDGRGVSDNYFIGHVMKRLFSLTRELPISIILVVHIEGDKVSKQIHIPTSTENLPNYLSITEDEMEGMINKPGLSWDSGRIPGLMDVHKMVGRMADYVIGLSRNIISHNDVVKRTLKTKILAARLSSDYMGKEMKLLYNPDTGRYEELECQQPAQ